MGCYRTNEADQYDDVPKASALYAEALSNHEKVRKKLKHLNRDSGTWYAFNLDRYALVLWSWANLL